MTHDWCRGSSSPIRMPVEVRRDHAQPLRASAAPITGLGETAAAVGVSEGGTFGDVRGRQVGTNVLQQRKAPHAVVQHRSKVARSGIDQTECLRDGMGHDFYFPIDQRVVEGVGAARGGNPCSDAQAFKDASASLVARIQHRFDNCSASPRGVARLFQKLPQGPCRTGTHSRPQPPGRLTFSRARRYCCHAHGINPKDPHPSTADAGG